MACRFFYLFALLLVVITPFSAQAADELIFVFQKQKEPEKIKTEAAKVAEFLSKELDQKVIAQVPNDYAASVQALVSKKADIAYVDSMAYLLAKRDAGATILLAEERPDTTGKVRTEYDSVFVVKKDSPLQSIDELVSKANSLRMVFTSPTSTSGYLMAYRRLHREGLLKAKQDPAQVFERVSFGGSYTQALEEVLAERADVAAVSSYTIEGAAADKYLPEAKRSNLRVLARTPGVPTHVIVARAGLSETKKEQIVAAIKKLQSQQASLLSDVYGAASFTEVEADTHVETAVQAVGLTGLPIEGIVSKKIVAKESAS